MGLLNIMKFLIVLTLASFVIACSDTDERGSGIGDCDKLVTALINLDNDQLDEILTPELDLLTLLDQDNNLCLHDNNLREFQDLLEESCEEITAIGDCCGCLFSQPPLTEVEIGVDSQGMQVTRFIRLLTPDQGEPMGFVSVVM